MKELEVGANKITILLTSEYFLNFILKLTWDDFWIRNTNIIPQFTDYIVRKKGVL